MSPHHQKQNSVAPKRSIQQLKVLLRSYVTCQLRDEWIIRHKSLQLAKKPKNSNGKPKTWLRRTMNLIRRCYEIVLSQQKLLVSPYPAIRHQQLICPFGISFWQFQFKLVVAHNEQQALTQHRGGFACFDILIVIAAPQCCRLLLLNAKGKKELQDFLVKLQTSTR